MKPVPLGKQPKLNLNEDLVADITVAVKTVLGNFFGIATAPEGEALHPGFAFVADVSARIDMCQQGDRDAFLITAFQEPSILGIVGKFYDRTFPVIDKTIMDGVGEITNSVYGLVKHRLNQRGYNYKLTIPELTRGQQRFVSDRSANVLVTFTTDFGVICVGAVICKS